MADNIFFDRQYLTSWADALREASGTSELLEFPKDFNRLVRSLTVAGAENVVEFTAPKGRMKGDVDGDGFITQTDRDIVNNHNKKKEFITDEIALWCADVNNNGKPNNSGEADISDVGIINSFLAGKQTILTATPTMADYYSNWTWSKVDDFSGYFYYDVPVSGMTASSSALLLASAYSDCFIGVECMDGIARVKAERLPLAETKCLIVWEADGTIWDDANGGFKTVDIDIPMGRMKGDIDGDGKITEADHTRLHRHLSGYAEDAITDEVEIWCSDINLKGTPDQIDLLRISKHLDGIMNVLVNVYDAGTNPDYYNNWTFVKVDDLNGYFYRDIPIEGMTASSTAVLLVSDYADCFEGVECLENAARIKASRCPVGNCKGNILWKTFEQVKSNAIVPMDLEVSETGLVTATAGNKTITHQIPNGDEVSY